MPKDGTPAPHRRPVGASPTRPSTLLVFDLSVSAGGRRLFSGLSLRVEPGAHLALLGPSGIGKTTLLRAVAGLIDPAAGRVTLGGLEPAEIGWPAYRRRVVYVAQRPVMVSGSVRRNLALPGTFLRPEQPLDEARATALLEAAGMGAAHLDQEARTLSEGQQQRVALVRALLLRPDHLLLDEPTSGLDARARDAVEALILRSGQERGTGALIVTHDPAQASRLGAKTLELRA